MPQRISFVSDLHLFTRRSEGSRYVGAIRAAARRSSALILGGDIFDFQWSTLSSIQATVDASIEWLEHLAADNPQCHIYYLLGNHDYCRPFLDQLESRTRAMPNFSWHPFCLRIGSNMFLHGDVAEERMSTHETLLEYRSRWLHAPMAGRLRRRAYDFVFRARLHRPLPYIIHWKRRVARRIVAYMNYLGEGAHTGVTDVYFGHIHRRMADYRYRGLMFHNGGAAISGQRLRILEAVCQDTDIAYGPKVADVPELSAGI
jgi:UDP-2,3-diacylglucosamine hydrolase